MDITQQGIITLMKSAVTGEQLQLPQGFELEAALKEIKRHKIHTLAFQGAVNCGISKSHPVMRQLFQMYYQTLIASETQMREIQKIYQAFDDHGIDYLPLKGCNMKKLYPKPELRIMGDADILIRETQYPDIVPVVESLGFMFQCESDHELIWKSAGLYLELHKRLVPSYQKDLSPYFESYWERAGIAEGRRHVMTREDEWLFLFTHFAKHFRDGGIGCRHVTDLWVFLRSQPDLDENYVRDALAELKLLEFYENMIALLGVWFEDNQQNELSEVLTACIFTSGNWGGNTVHVISDIIRKAGKQKLRSGKFLYLWKYAFPDLENMRRRHKILKKAPWLLPVMWIARLGYKILIDKKDLKKRKQDLSVITQENIRIRKELLNLLGLEYHKI